MTQNGTQVQTSPHTRFRIHQNAQGYWVASEKGGLVTGIFAIQRDALRFALSRLRLRIALADAGRQGRRCDDVARTVR